MSEYQEAWQEYKQRKGHFLGVMLVGGVAVLIVFVASGVLLHDELPAFFVMLPFSLLGLYVQSKFYAFRCPRCGKQFDRQFRLFRFHLFARKCNHCGLLRYSS
jgi:hypothetical protein